MNFNFELILFYATVISGVLALIDILFFKPARQRKIGAGGSDKLPVIFDYAYSFFPVLLIVFLLRSFLFEPFRIPSGSLEPTLLIGDFILVNKFDYGVRLPVIHKKVAGSGAPQRGDIIVFRWPPNPSVNFIKRVIGLPGDHISYVNKELTVNGQKVPQEFLQDVTVQTELSGDAQVQDKMENLLGIKHHIYIDPSKTSQDYKDIVVPPGMYFVMGDNRDDSADSRYWGFVPDQNIVGKAVVVWMSWNSGGSMFDWIRWRRLGTVV